MKGSWAWSVKWGAAWNPSGRVTRAAASLWQWR